MNLVYRATAAVKLYEILKSSKSFSICAYEYEIKVRYIHVFKTDDYYGFISFGSFSWVLQPNLAWSVCSFLLCFTIRIVTDKPPLSQHHKELPTELCPFYKIKLTLEVFEIKSWLFEDLLKS